MGVTDDSPPTALTPYFTVDDPAAFITFVEQVLGGQLLRINRNRPICTTCLGA